MFKHPALLFLRCGLPIVFCSLIGIMAVIFEAGPMTEAQAAYIGGMLEYPAAALMLLGVGAALLYYIEKKENDA